VKRAVQRPLVVAAGAAGGVLLLVLLSRRARAGTLAPGPVGSRRAPRAEVAAAIDSVSVAHPSLPRWFAWAMADKESGLEPTRHAGGGEDSFGLFQINWNAHGAVLAGRGITKEMLFDPQVNATYWGEIAAKPRAEAARRGVLGDMVWYAVRSRLKGGITWEQIARWDTDPEVQFVVNSFRPYVDKWRGRAA